MKRAITHNNETHCLAEWSRITGINVFTITQRLNSGWSVERALTEPAKLGQRDGHPWRKNNPTWLSGKRHG